MRKLSWLGLLCPQAPRASSLFIGELGRVEWAIDVVILGVVLDGEESPVA